MIAPDRVRAAFTRIGQAIDEGVPFAFQLVEWVIVAAALRWVGLVTGASEARAAALGATVLIAAWLARKIGPRFITPISWRPYGQPVRWALHVAAWALSVAAFVWAIYTLVSAMAGALLVLHDGAPQLPPENP